jgi:hypothetical protein
MARYIPIKGDGLVLIEQEIKTKKVVTKRGPVNHLWVFDRSGSMTWALPGLTQQLIDLTKKLPKGDSLSLGWFSSEGGEYDWIFKGFRIVDDSDYKSLEAAIKKNSHSIGCTCFSEILTNTIKVIDDLSVLSKTFSLHFFTDGYPVVSNYQREIGAIFSAIKKIKGKIHTAAFLGYGHGYNKELLSQMAEKLGAMLIHSSMIPEYADSITKLVKLTENAEPKEEVDPLISKPLAIFTITDHGIMLYAPDEDGKLYISPTKGDKTLVYYVSDEKPNKKSWDKVEASDINFGDNNDQVSKALYAAALVMTQQTKSDIALEVMGKIGDKAIIDNLNNAFQVEEYGAVENTINQAIQDVSLRFSNGRDPNYLPPADAFCVFDVLNMLLDDDEAAFFPYHEKFKYERIGVASTAKDDYAKFQADKTSKCPFNNLTWHEKFLNLSVQTRVSGSIDLKDRDGTTAKSLGLPTLYPTFVYRNFSFVKDGHTNIKTFYITSSEATYKEFKNKGIVVDDTFKSDKIYGVDISKLSAINRKIAEGKTSATDLCKAAIQEHKLKAQIKALKVLKAQETIQDIQSPFGHLNDAQTAFLKANGVSTDRDGSYNPPTVKEEPKDFYMAKYFDIALSGIATLPPVKKVQEKIASGKALTPSEVLLETGIKAWNARKGSLSSDAAKVKWFEGTIKDLQNQMKTLRKLKQETVFSVLLAKKWFDEFPGNRDNCELLVDGVKCVLKMGEEKVPV